MLEHLRPWLEATYFLSGFILAIVALYGIQQVRLLKRDIQTKNERALKCLSWLPAANELEHVSAAFTSGVANEELGFQVFGRSFCASVSSLYDLLSLCRKEEASTYFSSIVNLFKVWRSRLAKGDLEIDRKELDSQLSNMSETRIPIIGE